MLQPKDPDLLNGYENETCIYAVYNWPISDPGTHSMKVRRWKKIFHANRNWKKAGVAILISDKRDFKINTITIDNKGHYIMNKKSIQEDITIENIYEPNIGVPQYIRQMLTVTKGKINSNTMIVENSNTPLISLDRSFRQKINEKSKTVNDTLVQK